MTPNEFVMWLKGFADFSDEKSISDENWTKVRNALNRVYTTTDPTQSQWHVGGTTWPSTRVAGHGILTCSLDQPRIGFRNGDD